MYSFSGIWLESNYPKMIPMSGWFTFKLNGKELFYIPITLIPIVKIWENRIINLFFKYFGLIKRFFGFHKQKIYMFKIPVVIDGKDKIQVSVDFPEPVIVKPNIELAVKLFGEEINKEV